MEPLFDSFSASLASARGLAVLLDAALKGAAVLVLAGLLALGLRRLSAASRHLLWLLAMVSLLLLPALSALLPGWRLPIVPRSLSVAPVTVNRHAPDEIERVEPTGPVLASALPLPAAPDEWVRDEPIVSAAAPPTGVSWHWSAWALAVS